MEFTQIYAFGKLLAQFALGKPKILVKTQISPKTASLGVSNNINKSPQKSQNPCKINKKTIFRPKMGINCPLEWAKWSAEILT